MSSLSKLPDGEIFSLFFQRNSKNFFLYTDLTFGKVYYKKKALCLLSGKTTPSSFESLNNKLREEKLESQSYFKVWHLFYEYGHVTVGQAELIADTSILAIELCYRKKRKINLNSIDQVNIKYQKISEPNQKDYFTKFKHGYKKLQQGECYQFNLTENFLFQFNQSLSVSSLLLNFFKYQDRLSAYAHATNIPTLSTLFVSNSPECLFSLGKIANSEEDYWQLRTMPIKGTLRRKSGDDYKNLCKKLYSSEKNENELLMITDLLRNDLCRIEGPRAKVLALRKPLLVPGLLHQYSLIEVILSKNISLLEIVNSLFPGGSITGAPKKRVMKILCELEVRSRGFYCGSTLLIEEGRARASINIRSATIDLAKAQMEVAAGGGITLMSEAQDEFVELKAKLESFLAILGP